jgi:hypothetical protein
LVPRALIVTEWLAVLYSLPPWPSAALLVLCGAMGVFGLRGYRYFLAVATFAGGWLLGAWLAVQMNVAAVYVAAPLSVALAVPAYLRPVARPLLSVVIAFVVTCCVATGLTYGLRWLNFWIAALVGLVAGMLLGFLLRRPAAILLFASVSAAGLLAASGGLFAAPVGYFSRGGFLEYPLQSSAVAAVLATVSIGLQRWWTTDWQE